MSREAFDKWAADKTFLIKAGGDYVNVRQMAWEAWKAALESQEGGVVAAVNKSHISEAIFSYGLRNDDGNNLSMDDTDEIAEYILARAGVDDLQPKVPEGSTLKQLLEAVQDILQDSYQSAYPVCCGRSGHECCGSPEPEWSESDQKIMDLLGPVQRELSAMLAASQEQGNNNG